MEPEGSLPHSQASATCPYVASCSKVTMFATLLFLMVRN